MNNVSTSVVYKFLDVESACEAEKSRVKYLFLEYNEGDMTA